MSKNLKVSKTTRADRIRKVKAGLVKYYPAVNLLLGGMTYTPSDLQVFLQKDVDANDASTAARASWLQAVAAARACDASTDPILAAIEHAVQAQYAGSTTASAVMTDFGYASPNRKVLTAAEKAAAAAKAKATREARHTMGKRQKAKVTGETPAPIAQGAASGTTETVASAPAPAATPAAPAQNGSTPVRP